ncbi:MAG: hypothetical protein GWP11_03270 [Proteobacteria bacterium]|nr:hypothetical protein [Pseudomonadota bacterium]
MNKQGIARMKPGVSRAAHLFAAPFIWTVVGAVLMLRGWIWIGSGTAHWFVLLALVLGTFKSLLVLDKAARRTIHRINGMEDGTCIGAVYSWKMWLLVGVMMASGITLRHLFHPGIVIGTLYMTIGWALFLSSRHGWAAWLRRLRK